MAFICACGQTRLRIDLLFAEIETCSLSEIIAEIIIMKFDQFFQTSSRQKSVEVKDNLDE